MYRPGPAANTISVRCGASVMMRDAWESGDAWAVAAELVAGTAAVAPAVARPGTKPTAAIVKNGNRARQSFGRRKRAGRGGGRRACLPDAGRAAPLPLAIRSEEHTSELQSLMRISYAVFCLKKKTKQYQPTKL